MSFFLLKASPIKRQHEKRTAFDGSSVEYPVLCHFPPAVYLHIIMIAIIKKNIKKYFIVLFFNYEHDTI